MDTRTSIVGDAMNMAADIILDEVGGHEARPERWARTLECGTVRVRIRVEVEATGVTVEEAAAEAIAADPGEAPEVRAAARIVAAGGPGREAALRVLRATGPWPC
ncbi:hypothetical protein [Streptomyces sp. ME01-18h]|uniref:hypothetical protein n=1 Tax=Streptomyces sp. ME01-18h TaxID=462920 RepID=UPI0029B045BF|nr:hypothetical protein [Streptomyces sp. ME01-18h]MDX3400073.1 hypothetical protein [Streptomyces sp. ME01-18h]